jgi:hypothetical protein
MSKKRRKRLVRIPEELQPAGRLKIPTLRFTQENKKQLMFTVVGTHPLMPAEDISAKSSMVRGW